MSKFRQIVDRKDGIDESGKPSWFDALHSIAPEVACILSGEPAADGKPAVPPHSIILSDRKGTLQFCISRQESPDMWFGQIEDPTQLLSEIEARIGLNELVYQQKRDKRGGYRPS